MGGDFGKGDGWGMGGGYGIGMGGPHKGERGTSSEGLEIRPGDWKCLECKNVNFSWRDKCNKCEKHKGDAVPIMQGSGRSHGSQRRGLGGPLEARPEDWVCTTCYNLNFSSRTKCNGTLTNGDVCLNLAEEKEDLCTNCKFSKKGCVNGQEVRYIRPLGKNISLFPKGSLF